MKLKFYSFIVLILTLSVSMSTCANDDVVNHSSQTSKVTSIISYTNDGSSPVATVYINGKGPFRFLFDTGATLTRISRKLANELQISNAKAEDVNTTEVRSVRYQGAEIVNPTEKVNLELFDTRVKRVTRLYAPIDDTQSTPHDGILGISELQGALIRNHPNSRHLEIIMDRDKELCDRRTSETDCIKEINPAKTLIQIGKTPALLIADTGDEVSTSIIMDKSDLTKKIWHKGAAHISEVTSVLNGAPISDLPVKYVSTNDFRILSDFERFDDPTLSTTQCLGNFTIRNPDDSSFDRGDLTVGKLPWYGLSKVPFELDFRGEGFLNYPSECPFPSEKTVGIIGLNGVGQNEEIYGWSVFKLDSHLPAIHDGIQYGDIITDLRFEDGRVVSNFKTDTSKLREYFNSPEGTKLIFTVDRNGEEIEITVTAKGQPLIDLSEY